MFCPKLASYYLTEEEQAARAEDSRRLFQEMKPPQD